MSTLNLFSQYPRHLFVIIFGLLLLIGGLACNGLTGGTAEPDPTTTGAPTTSSNPAETDAPEPSAEPTFTPLPQPQGEYILDRLVTSPREPFDTYPMRVYSVAFEPEQLVFVVGFENHNDNTGTFLQELTPEAFVLVDGAGQSHTAESLSDDLMTITPEDGLLPATANVGRVAFSIPAGPLPYQLQFLEPAEYGTITLSQDDLTAGEPLPGLAAGSYELGVTMFSHNEIFEAVEIQVYSATVSAETMTFYLGFTNTGLSPHNTVPTPTGYDSRLLDQTRQGRPPVEVSPSFETTVYSEDFLFPQEIYAGYITFERPPEMNAGYFVFEGYEPLYWAAAEDGTLTAELQAAGGESAAQRPTPTAGELALEEVFALLDQQAAALAAGDRETHQNLVNPSAGEFTAGFFDAVTAVPLQDVTMHVQPLEDRDEQALGGQVSALPVLVEVRPSGYDGAYSHVLDLTYTLSRGAGGWVIDDITPQDDLALWMRDGIVYLETEHYYLFASTAFSSSLPTAAEEIEAAYAVLAGRNLPLAGKYSVYYAAAPEEFEALGGLPELAGIALSRTRFLGGEWKVVDSFFMMNDEIIQEVPAEIRVSYVAHELTHLVLAPFSRPAMPLWLLEGVAEYFAGTPQRVNGSNQSEVLSLSLVELTAQEALTTTADADIYYGFFGSLVNYLVESYGEDAVLDFYYAYSTLPFDETAEEFQVSLTERLVTEFFGVTLEQLDADFEAWLVG